MNEIWRDIKGYEGLYKVSNLGNVVSLKYQGKIREVPYFMSFDDNHGYKRVTLTMNGIKKKIFVHRLVAEAFIPNLENKPYIDHINTIRDDNRVDNLRWVTHSENILNELTNNKRSNSLKGESNGMYGVNLTDDQKENISKKLGKTILVYRYDNDDFVGEYHSGREADRMLGSSKISGTIHRESGKAFSKILDCYIYAKYK